MRLDKVLADAGLGTRKELRDAIKSGRAAIDGVTARDPSAYADPSAQIITFDGEDCGWEENYTIMLSKPAGVVCAAQDNINRTVLDLLPPIWLRRGVMPVGRLDKDTTGLLLLTTDGALNRRLTSPSHHIEKEYLVTLDAPLREEMTQAFRRGIALNDGTLCREAELVILSENTAHVILREGMYHQVKRMFGALGLGVVSLHRSRVGDLRLDEGLLPGEFRPLTKSELSELML